MSDYLTADELGAAVTDPEGDKLLAAVTHPHPDPDAVVARTEAREAAAQILMELGFLTEEEAADLHLDGDALPGPLVRALTDMVSEDPAGAAWTGFPSESTADVPAVLMERLEALVELNGPFAFPAREYVAGHRSTYTRALHYRLAALGLDVPSPADPLDQRTYLALTELAFYVGADQPIPLEATPPREGDGATAMEELLATLGSLDGLSGGYLTTRGPWPVIALTSASAPGKADPVLFGQDSVGKWHLIRGTRDLRRIESLFVPRVRDDLAGALRSWPGPAALYGDAGNGFGITLLQLVLWTNGFYRGRIDGVWGEEATRALDEALAFLDLKKESVLLPLGGGYLAIDIREILRQLSGLVIEADLDAQLRHMCSNAEVLDKASQEVTDAEGRQSLLSRAWHKVRNGLKDIVQTGRKVYRGLRHVLKVGMDAFRKGFRWVGDQLAKLVGPVRHLVRAMAQAMSYVSTFARALRFLLDFMLRRPQGVYSPSDDGVVLTHFDFDADAVVAVLGRTDQGMIQRHMREVRNAARWSGLLMRLAVQVAKAVATLSPPLLWIRFAVTIGSTAKAVLDEVRGRHAIPAPMW